MKKWIKFFILVIVLFLILIIFNQIFKKEIINNDEINKEIIVEEIIVEEGDEDLTNEKILVEKYLRENIKNIATNDPVLGGSWYVAEINIDALNNSGEVIYEDGHIQSKANFIYQYNKENGEITITDFKVIS